MKKQIILILSVFSLLILNSCSSVSSTSHLTLSVTNQTTEEFQIRVPELSSEIFYVSADAMRTEIYKYNLTESSCIHPLIGKMNVYIYHPVDSSYMLLTIGWKRKDYKYVEETYDYRGCDDFLYTWDVYLEVIIDDAMLKEMTKDTALTNRIFWLD